MDSERNLQTNTELGKRIEARIRNYIDGQKDRGTYHGATGKVVNEGWHMLDHLVKLFVQHGQKPFRRRDFFHLTRYVCEHLTMTEVSNDGFQECAFASDVQEALDTPPLARNGASPPYPMGTTTGTFDELWGSERDHAKIFSTLVWAVGRKYLLCLEREHEAEELLLYWYGRCEQLQASTDGSGSHIYRALAAHLLAETSWAKGERSAAVRWWLLAFFDDLMNGLCGSDPPWPPVYEFITQNTDSDSRLEGKPERSLMLEVAEKWTKLHRYLLNNLGSYHALHVRAGYSSKQLRSLVNVYWSALTSTDGLLHRTRVHLHPSDVQTPSPFLFPELYLTLALGGQHSVPPSHLWAGGTRASHPISKTFLQAMNGHWLYKSESVPKETASDKQRREHQAKLFEHYMAYLLGAIEGFLPLIDVDTPWKTGQHDVVVLNNANDAVRQAFFGELVLVECKFSTHDDTNAPVMVVRDFMMRMDMVGARFGILAAAVSGGEHDKYASAVIHHYRGAHKVVDLRQSGVTDNFLKDHEGLQIPGEAFLQLIMDRYLERAFPRRQREK